MFLPSVSGTRARFKDQTLRAEYLTCKVGLALLAGQDIENWCLLPPRLAFRTCM